MNKKRNGFLLGVVFLTGAVIVLLVYFMRGQKEKKSVDIAFSICEEQTSRSTALVNDIISCAKADGRSIEMRCAENEVRKQENDIRELMLLQPKYLLVIPSKTIGLESVLNEASDAGIQVIIVDRNMKQSLYQDYMTQISSDAYEEGRMCAQTLGNYFAGREAKILEIQGRAGSSLTNDRSKGFRDQLCEYDNLEIAKVLYGDFDRIEANHSVKEYMNQDGTFDAVFGHSDEEGLGAMTALLGLKDGNQIPIVSVNGQQEIRGALLSGKYLASIYATPMLGSEIMDVIATYERGEIPQKEIIIPVVLYEQSNAIAMQEY